MAAASNIVMRRAVGGSTSAPEQAQGRGEGLKHVAAGAQGFDAQEAKLRPAAAEPKGDGVQMKEAEPAKGADSKAEENRRGGRKNRKRSKTVIGH